jgi:hypothetical protein
MRNAGLFVLICMGVFACRCQDGDGGFVPDIGYVDLGPLGDTEVGITPSQRYDGPDEYSKGQGLGDHTLLSPLGPDKGELVINELMVNPAGTKDVDGEYLEVRNISDRTVDLFGLVVRDHGTDNFMVKEHLELAPGGLAVLSRKGETGVNGGFKADFVYGAKMSLANSEDEVVLEYGGQVVDQVFYDKKGYNVQAGFALELDPFLCGAIENDFTDSWCPSSGSIPSGDSGTPGRENLGCN